MSYQTSSRGRVHALTTQKVNSLRGRLPHKQGSVKATKHCGNIMRLQRKHTARACSRFKSYSLVGLLAHAFRPLVFALVKHTRSSSRFRALRAGSVSAHTSLLAYKLSSRSALTTVDSASYSSLAQGRSSRSISRMVKNWVQDNPAGQHSSISKRTQGVALVTTQMTSNVENSHASFMSTNSSGSYVFDANALVAQALAQAPSVSYTEIQPIKPNIAPFTSTNASVLSSLARGARRNFFAQVKQKAAALASKRSSRALSCDTTLEALQRLSFRTDKPIVTEAVIDVATFEKKQSVSAQELNASSNDHELDNSFVVEHVYHHAHVAEDKAQATQENSSSLEAKQVEAYSLPLTSHDYALVEKANLSEDVQVLDMLASIDAQAQEAATYDFLLQEQERLDKAPKVAHRIGARKLGLRAKWHSKLHGALADFDRHFRAYFSHADLALQGARAASVTGPFHGALSHTLATTSSARLAYIEHIARQAKEREQKRRAAKLQAVSLELKQEEQARFFDANAPYTQYQEVVGKKRSARAAQALTDASSALSAIFGMSYFNTEEAEHYRQAQVNEQQQQELLTRLAKEQVVSELEYELSSTKVVMPDNMPEQAPKSAMNYEAEAKHASELSEELVHSLHDSEQASVVCKALSGKNTLNSEVLDDLSFASFKALGVQKRRERKLSSYLAFFREELNDHLKGADNNHRVAAVLAYGIFRQWLHRRRNSVISGNETIYETNESMFYYTAMLLVQTMVFAIRADGRIEREEYRSLFDFCSSVFNKQIKNIRGEIDRMLTIDLDPEVLVQKIKFPEESLDIYLLSAVMLNPEHLLVQSYLENLAACLQIDPTLRRKLDLRAQMLLQKEPSQIDIKDQTSQAF